MYQKFDFAITQVNVRAMPPRYFHTRRDDHATKFIARWNFRWISRWVFMEGSIPSQVLFPDLGLTLVDLECGGSSNKKGAIHVIEFYQHIIQWQNRHISRRSSLHINRPFRVSGLRYKAWLHLWLWYLGQLQSYLEGGFRWREMCTKRFRSHKPWSRYQMYEDCSCYRLCIKYLLRNPGKKNDTQHRHLLWNLQLWLVIIWSGAGSHSIGDHQICVWIFFSAMICIASRAITAFPCIPYQFYKSCVRI